MDDNKQAGYDTYINGDSETRSWFDQQLRQWPHRVHPERTTNTSFLHGGMIAYHAIHGAQPEISGQFSLYIKCATRFSE